MASSPPSIDLLDFQPDKLVSLHTAFPECKGFTDFQIPAFSQKSDLVPSVDPSYQLNPQASVAILAGFAYNRRVMLQGMHGTGKSTHLEQVAARLNWPCLRINLDGQITRMDLIGKDIITLEDGKQVTQFQEGLIPWSLQRSIALILDEYDAGQADVMFVIQRMLEREGRLTLLDQNRVIEPNPAFRIFATSNTVGLGNWSGMYQGTQLLNHGQMDRWDIVAALNYLEPEEEEKVEDEEEEEKMPDYQPDTSTVKGALMCLQAMSEVFPYSKITGEILLHAIKALAGDGAGSSSVT